MQPIYQNDRKGPLYCCVKVRMSDTSPITDKLPVLGEISVFWRFWIIWTIQNWQEHLRNTMIESVWFKNR